MQRDEIDAQRTELLAELDKVLRGTRYTVKAQNYNLVARAQLIKHLIKLRAACLGPTGNVEVNPLAPGITQGVFLPQVNLLICRHTGITDSHKHLRPSQKRTVTVYNGT